MLLQRAIVSLLPLVPRPIVWRVSRRYIAGKTLDSALELVARLNRRGMCATLDLLGEDSATEDEALASKRVYMQALEEIERRALDCNVSVKLSQMGLRFDGELCAVIVTELLESAERRKNFVRIDMEDSSVTTATLDLYRRLRRRFRCVGTVIQAYLRRSRRDVEELLRDGPTSLRLCKGIYVEPEEVAFQGREEIRASFRDLLERMLREGVERVGIATHDSPLIDSARELTRRLEVPPERFEFQMLLGVTEGLRDRLVAEGYRLRIYVPFGEAWFAYSYRRLRENPGIAGHIVRNLFARD